MKHETFCPTVVPLPGIAYEIGILDMHSKRIKVSNNALETKTYYKSKYDITAA